jgi:hypothetical protein
MLEVKSAWLYLQSHLDKTSQFDELNLIYNAKLDCYECNRNVILNLKYHHVFIGCISNRITIGRFTGIINDVKYKYSLYDPSIVLSELAFAKICNGIGSNGMGYLVPDLKYKQCGNKHDLKYSIGNTKSDKKWADYTFLWDMKRITPYSIIPFIYFLAVKLFGDFAFNFGQKKYSIVELNKKM